MSRKLGFALASLTILTGACAAPTSAGSREDLGVSADAIDSLFCVGFTPSNLAVKYQGGSNPALAYAMNDPATGFYKRFPSLASANRFIQVATALGARSDCVVLDGTSLNDDAAELFQDASGKSVGDASTPSPIAGETCQTIVPTAVAIATVSGGAMASVVQGSTTLVGPIATTPASGIASYIRTSYLVQRCQVGGGVSADGGWEYWKANPPVAADANIPAPAGAKPAAPSCTMTATCDSNVAIKCAADGAAALYVTRAASTGPNSAVALDAIDQAAWSDVYDGITTEVITACAKTSGGTTCAPATTLAIPHNACGGAGKTTPIVKCTNGVCTQPTNPTPPGSNY